jgi:hypothetical protein
MRHRKGIARPILNLHELTSLWITSPFGHFRTHRASGAPGRVYPAYTASNLGMPERRQRPSALPDGVRDAVTAELQSLAQVADPLERMGLVGEFYAALDHELERIAQARLEAVRDLRAQGWSYDRIASAAGITKGRVAQLARKAGAGGRAIDG